MTPPRTDKTRSCEGCQTPIPLSRNTRSKRCPQCQQLYAQSRGEVQGALRYSKAESRRAMADVLDRGVRSRSEERRAGSTVRPMPRAWRKGQDMTAPIRKRDPYRGGCSVEGCGLPAQARDMCNAHYARWWRDGDAADMDRPTRAPMSDERRALDVEKENTKLQARIDELESTVRKLVASQKPGPGPKVRSCMMCGDHFQSTGAANRMCGRCKNAGVSPYAV